jgi:hypothetical protein
MLVVYSQDGSVSATADDGATTAIPAGSQADQDAAVSAFRLAHPDAVIVPDEVSMLQAEIALTMGGWIDTVNAFIASAPPVVQIAWKRAATVHRLSQTLAVVQAGINMSDEQRDALFVQAATITV